MAASEASACPAASVVALQEPRSTSSVAERAMTSKSTAAPASGPFSTPIAVPTSSSTSTGTVMSSLGRKVVLPEPMVTMAFS